MEARLLSAALAVAALLSLGASYRTQNFIVAAPSPQLAREIGDAAESYRRQLAQEWLGAELPAWGQPCPIRVQVGPHFGAGGATSFMFDAGRPYGWTMSIQGSRQRLLDSVLPHEITHTVFATHFGRPLPRWADEGACTTVEHEAEMSKQKQMLVSFLTTGRGIAFNRMFAMKEYPHDIMPLYAQGYSLARFLIAQGGKQKFVRYVGDGMDWNNWTAATKKHYGYKNLSELQVTWLDWVRRGYPPIEDRTLLASRQHEPPVSVTDSHTIAAAAGDTADSNLIPVPPLGTPPVDALAAGSASDGWRARGRGRTPSPAAAMVASHGADSPAGDATAVAGAGSARPVPQSVTRPQPVGRPQQLILQWSRTDTPSAPASQGPTGGGYQRSAPGQSYYAVPRRDTGTVLR